MNFFRESSCRQLDGLDDSKQSRGRLRLAQFGSPRQCVRDAGADICGTHVAFKLGLLHQLRWLFASTAQEKLPPGGMNAVGEFSNRAEARGINGGHVAQTQNDHGRQPVQVFQNVGEFVGGAKQERSMYANHHRIVGDVLALQDMIGMSAT